MGKLQWKRIDPFCVLCILEFAKHFPEADEYKEIYECLL